MSIVSDNLARIQSNISCAAHKSGRAASDIKLIAVTKRQPDDLVRLAYAAGLRTMAENDAKEIDKKFTLFPDVNWQMIGQCQTNKVKYLVNKITMIQSVDRTSLAHELEKRFCAADTPVDVLMQVNIGQDPAKGGISPEEALTLAEEILGLPHLRLKGLMTVPPLVTCPEDNRPYFAQMRELLRTCADRYGEEYFSVLSMGMTDDYVVAIEEGATMVRLGTALFGKRDYHSIELQ